jgi:hypothetical protein
MGPKLAALKKVRVLKQASFFMHALLPVMAIMACVCYQLVYVFLLPVPMPCFHQPVLAPYCAILLPLLL